MNYSNANLPRKRVGATALFLDALGNILIVKPTYRDGWLTPGGTVNENETPREGCAREVSEELGLNCKIGRLLGLGYRSRHGDKVENIQFVFWGAVLSYEDESAISLQEEELEEYRFCPVNQLGKHLNEHLANRIKLAYEAHESGQCFYEENMRLS